MNIIRYFSVEKFLVLFIALSAGLMTYFQSQQLVLLTDFSYLIENAYRIYIGQIPYKDFILVLPPLTYYISALIMNFVGLSYIYQVLFSCLISFLTVVCTYGILNEISRNKSLNLILLVPLLFTGHSIYPFPSYDMNVVLSILVAVYYIFKLKAYNSHYFDYFVTGILITIPILLKQNSGFVFFISIFLLIFFTKVLNKDNHQIKKTLSIFTGIVLVLGLFVWLLIANNALNNYIFQTFSFPAEARNPIHSLGLIVKDLLRKRTLFLFLSLFIGSLIIVKSKLKKSAKNIFLIGLITFFFLILPFFYTLYKEAAYISSTPIQILLGTGFNYFLSIWYVLIFAVIMILLFEIKYRLKVHVNSIFEVFLPLVFILVIISSFLSQILLSTYGIYPFFIILLALTRKKLDKYLKNINWSGLFKLIALIITFNFILYIYIFPRTTDTGKSGSLKKFSHKKLAGMTTNETYVIEMENMIKYVDNFIPLNDRVIALPGEDPFYFLTMRKPILNTHQLLPGTFPYKLEIYTDYLLSQKIEWIIVKKNLQIQDYLDTSLVLKTLHKHYTIYYRLPGYDIYHKKEFNHNRKQ